MLPRYYGNYERLIRNGDHKEEEKQGLVWLRKNGFEVGLILKNLKLKLNDGHTFVEFQN